VNLFLDQEPEKPDFGVLNIMIAEAESRGKGLATEACKLMMEYGQKEINLKGFVAKINSDNEASIKLFRDKLGFEKYGELKMECDDFKIDEVHFHKLV
jgi:RimJ/RimL family protein N-acetyltransferase